MAAIGAAVIFVIAIEKITHSQRIKYLQEQSAFLCEGCGYDLTHLPEQGNCTECSLPLIDSLKPYSRRFGCSWQDQTSSDAWFKATLFAALRPRAFYKHLKMKAPESQARWFALIHLLVMGSLASGWLIVVLVAKVPINEMLTLVTLLGPMIALLGWGLHRLSTAVVTTWFVIRKPAIKYQYLRIIFSYETVYLWWFCAFNAMAITSFILWGSWVSRFFFLMSFRVFGISGEAILLVFGNVVLLLYWFYRYRIAILRTQWSNF